MRQRLTFLVAVSTTSVILAFLVPLALLLRTLASNVALNTAQTYGQWAAGTAGLAMTSDLDPATALGKGVGAQTFGVMSVILPNDTVIGPPVNLKDEDLKTARGGKPTTVTGAHSSVVYMISQNKAGVVVARVEVPEATLHAGVSSASAIIGGLALLLMLAAVVAADRMARRFTRPIQRVVDAAEALRAGRLETRVEEDDGPPEIQAVAGALNRLASRIEELLVAERDAVADLSHRLRTPVTALRLDADGVMDPDLGERLRTHVAHLERTVDAIVHDAKRPTRAPVNVSCDIGRVVGERVNFWSALAEEQGRPFYYAIPDHSLRVRLDATDLADVIDVLIDNAFAYTEEGTGIEIWVVPRSDGEVVLTIEDSGPGLPDGNIMARGESRAGSSGLGLDIVRRAALASGGNIELGRSRLGGALIRVVLGRARF